MDIKIKYHEGIDRITKIEEGDWIDLRASRDVFIPLNTYALIPLGVSMELPEGYEAHVLPRSSTFKNFGIIMTNSMGVIDNSYSGDDDIWHFPAFCLAGGCIRDGVRGTLIKKGDRICQFRIMKRMGDVNFKEVEIIGNKSRGGFGSTGIS